ncbi:hypothetical protein PMIN01_01772 [Paraphaeosphaeria minitans]|uniref:Uncharacterized protein n=1 Tax=Paraphaeosphaeria minitans TaxID=565426 RepID=A0A9P6GQ33_9PLEO|nr:hypothetical protein PMIN01_01772 [Paraphaeosphaeria minitans]
MRARYSGRARHSAFGVRCELGARGSGTLSWHWAVSPDYVDISLQPQYGGRDGLRQGHGSVLQERRGGIRGKRWAQRSIESRKGGGIKYASNQGKRILARVAHSISHGFRTLPTSSVGAATLAFASQAAPEGMHALTLKPNKWGLRTEAFVLNSVQYLWEMDSTWHSTHMTLYKMFGEGKTATRETVAKYAEKWWKKRQRAVERRSGGE